MKYESAIKQVNKAQVSERNKQLILDFNEALILENISKPRLIRYLSLVKVISEEYRKVFNEHQQPAVWGM